LTPGPNGLFHPNAGRWASRRVRMPLDGLLSMLLACFVRAARVNDEFALAQLSVIPRHSHPLGGTKADVGAGPAEADVEAAVGFLGAAGRVDCNATPEVCHDGLFECQDWNFMEFDLRDITAPSSGSGARARSSRRGHPNPHSMCTASYLPAWYQCLKGDPVKGAHMTYEIQGDDKIRTIDASYCFAAGHCNNTKVNNGTKLNQAEEMCDAIYGHEAWVGFGFAHILGAKATDVGRTNKWAQLACAMGNWHCDVMYCQEMYCHNPLWRPANLQYSHWMPSTHWRGYLDAPAFGPPGEEDVAAPLRPW